MNAKQLPLSIASTGGPPLGDLLMNRYRLDSVVGRGGGSVVYRATDVLLNMTVAVKVLLTDTGSALQMGLRNEAVAAMRLHHLNIVRVFNYEEDPSWTFLVMEYLDGVDCQVARKSYPDRRLPMSKILNVMDATFDALAYAHLMGVAHHDVKPSNIVLLHSGVVKVCDFGIATTLNSASASHGAATLGTPAFMAPERIRGQVGDARSDVYSLGATLYTLLMGSTPFGNDVPGVFERHLSDDIPRPPGLKEALYQVIAKAMAKRPEDRYEGIEDFRRDFAWLHPSPNEPLPLGVHAVSDTDVIPFEVDLTEESAPVAQEIPRGMVEVPLYEFQSKYTGNTHAVSPFFLDIFPVTNAEFAEFIAATDETPPDYWPGRTPPPLADSHPVVGINLGQAKRYANWRGKRLPTSLEWEAAARAPDGRIFPWGDEFIPDAVHGPHFGATGTAPVGLLVENISALGLRDLVGNVWEWTETDEQDRPPEDGYVWVFGGSFRHDCQPSERMARNSVRASNAYAYLGFRCARSK